MPGADEMSLFLKATSRTSSILILPNAGLEVAFLPPGIFLPAVCAYGKVFS